MTKERSLKYFVENYGREHTDEEIIKAYIEVNGLVGLYKGIIDKLTEQEFPDEYQHLINKDTLIADIKDYAERDTTHFWGIDIDEIIGIIEDAEEWGA